MTSEQTRQRIEEFFRGKLSSRIQFEVHPRFAFYGSPPDIETAVKLARLEREAYDAIQCGMFGCHAQARAKRLGLGKGIVEVLYETRKGWEVLDLITGVRSLRPFKTNFRRKYVKNNAQTK